MVSLRQQCRAISCLGIAGCMLSSVLVAQEPASAPQNANTQTLSLFEAVELSDSGVRAGARPNQESRATVSSPEFTLVGTSRIGDSYSAIIRHREGEVLSIAVQPNSNTTIPGHSEYSIVGVSPKGVSVRYPQNNPCVDFSDKGVTCSSAANIASLVLSNGEPIARSEVTGGIESIESDTGQFGAENSNPDQQLNPFEALRNAQNTRRTGGQDSVGNRFVPRRINPDEVPDGMRIVATPFGDRLVEQ